MAINACTLDGFTINSRSCSNKFKILVPILHPGTGGAQPNGWTQGRPPAYYRGINPPRWEQPEAPREAPTELDRITVTAEIFGVSGTDTQSVVARPDLVTVTDIHIVPTEVGVNILNFQVH